MGALDGIRTLLKIRKDRNLGPPGPKPRLGAKIAMQDVRITVQAGLTDEMWRWLTELGFREITFQPDRRIYRDVPPSYVTRLFDADPQDWRTWLTRAIRESCKRPRAVASSRASRISA